MSFAATSFDVAIVFSTDTDQLPTLELLFHKLPPKVEVACWTGTKPLWFPENVARQPAAQAAVLPLPQRGCFNECRDYRVTL